MLTARRDARAGAQAEAPALWPDGSTAERATGRSTLLLFAHPRCPCTRATLRELERIVARAGDRLLAQVLFCLPDGAPPGWEHGDLWEQAERLPGVRVARDPGAREARRFGAATSGDAVLYDAEGRLRYHGGITGSRGHEGDNAGRAAVLDHVLEGRADACEGPAFGCPLLDAGASADARASANVRANARAGAREEVRP